MRERKLYYGRCYRLRLFQPCREDRTGNFFQQANLKQVRLKLTYSALILDWGVICFRIASIIDDFIKNESLLEDLNRDEMVKYFVNLLTEKFSSSELETMPDESLGRKIRRVLGVQAMAGLLKDLTPEQMAEFEAVMASFR